MVRAALTFKGFCLAWTQRLDVNGPGRVIPGFDSIVQISGSKVGVCPSEFIRFGRSMITDALIGEGLDSDNALTSLRERWES